MNHPFFLARLATTPRSFAAGPQEPPCSATRDPGRFAVSARAAARQPGSMRAGEEGRDFASLFSVLGLDPVAHPGRLAAHGSRR